MSQYDARLVIQDMADDARMTMGEMSRSLARIETELGKVINDHEDRLRRVERWVWLTSGLAAAGFGSSLVAWLQLLGKG